MDFPTILSAIEQLTLQKQRLISQKQLIVSQYRAQSLDLQCPPAPALPPSQKSPMNAESTETTLTDAWIALKRQEICLREKRDSLLVERMEILSHNKTLGEELASLGWLQDESMMRIRRRHEVAVFEEPGYRERCEWQQVAEAESKQRQNRQRQEEILKLDKMLEVEKEQTLQRYAEYERLKAANESLSDHSSKLKNQEEQLRYKLLGKKAQNTRLLKQADKLASEGQHIRNWAAKVELMNSIKEELVEAASRWVSSVEDYEIARTESTAEL